MSKYSVTRILLYVFDDFAPNPYLLKRKIANKRGSSPIVSEDFAFYRFLLRPRLFWLIPPKHIMVLSVVPSYNEKKNVMV